LLNKKSTNHKEIKKQKSYINLWPNFKHDVLSSLDKLLGATYMDWRITMSSFQSNYNKSKIPHVTYDMSQIIHKNLVW
jgi:hypothetical protein